jgi:tRNA(adenine34) deaminase
MDKTWMNLALQLAEQANQNEEVPVGAVLVLENQVIGQGFNQVIATHDPSAHAEVVAIRQACLHLKNERLPGATLYVTLEPCLMCLGAMLQARISRLVFGTRDFRTGAAGSKLNLATGFGAYASIQVDEGVCQAACEDLLKRFFQQKR